MICSKDTDPLLKRPVVAEPVSEAIDDPFAESFFETERESSPAFLPDTFENLQETGYVQTPAEESLAPAGEFYLEEDIFDGFSSDSEFPPDLGSSPKPPRESKMTGGQRMVIGILVVIEIVVILVFAYIVLRDLGMI